MPSNKCVDCFFITFVLGCVAGFACTALLLNDHYTIDSYSNSKCGPVFHVETDYGICSDAKIHTVANGINVTLHASPTITGIRCSSTGTIRNTLASLTDSFNCKLETRPVNGTKGVIEGFVSPPDDVFGIWVAALILGALTTFFVIIICMCIYEELRDKIKGCLRVNTSRV